MNDVLIPTLGTGGLLGSGASVDKQWIPNRARLGAIIAALCLGTFAVSSAQSAPFYFTPTGSMATGRVLHTATLLQNGKVLVVGDAEIGAFATAEIYDPATGSWAATGNPAKARAGHTATLLPSGKVLVAGGVGKNGGIEKTAELYDPASGSWSFTAALRRARWNSTATLLQNGKVLVAGGNYNETGDTAVPPKAGAELYDPATGTWSTTASLSEGREGHTATLLENGNVLVTGGYFEGDSYIGLASAELYHPATETWSPAAEMATPRPLHTASLLGGGKVLVSGGIDLNNGHGLASAELYDPANDSWKSAGSFSTPRGLHTATILADGRVLLTGGDNVNDTGSSVVQTSVLFDPANGTWSDTASLKVPRRDHTATRLQNGNVLVAGGDRGTGIGLLASAELYVTDGSATTLRNISTRLLVQTGDNVEIGGFIISGSAAKKVIIRAIGPSLGIPGALADPTLVLYAAKGNVVQNDNWKENQAAVEATTIPPQSDEESAIVAILPAGEYTAMVQGKGGTTGIGLVEVYDLEASTAPSILANTSTRGQVETGDNVMIAGLIVGGSNNFTQVAVRGLGPSLQESGLANVLADPTLDLRNANGEQLSFNDDWNSDSDSANALIAEGLAPDRSLEAAIFTSLPPGSYTAILAGNGGSGLGLVEVYNIR